MKLIQLSSLSLLIALIVMSCGKPNDPETIYSSGGYTIIKRFTTPANALDVIVRDTLCYLAQGEGGLLIVNTKDASNPQTVSVTTAGISGYARRIVRKDNIVYLATGSFGFSGINVLNPFLPIRTVDNLGIKPSIDAIIRGNYLFCAVSDNGVKIAELSNPALPDIRPGYISTNGYANGIAINEDMTRMFVACGEMGVSIYDISDFQEGYGTYPLISWIDTPGYAEAIVLNEEQSIAYVAMGAEGLQIVDYSDITNPQLVTSMSTGGTAFDLMYKNQRVFIALQKGGFQIIDVSVNSNPHEIARLNLKKAMGFDMDENYIYVADEEEGLVVISIPQ